MGKTMRRMPSVDNELVMCRTVLDGWAVCDDLQHGDLDHHGMANERVLHSVPQAPNCLAPMPGMQWFDGLCWLWPITSLEAAPRRLHAVPG